MSKFADIVRVGLALALSAPGCHGRDDLDGSRRPIPGLAERSTPSARPAPDHTVHYDLFDNRVSASVYSAGSLVIDPVRPTMAQLAGGGWHAATVDGKRAALVEGIGGTVTVPLDFDPGGIARSGVRFHIWARPAVPKQLMSVLIDERRVGDISMPEATWKRYSLDVPADAIRGGEVRIRLYFRRVGEIGGVSTAAAVSRIAIGGRAPAEEPVVTAGAVDHNSERRSALRVAGPARLSFYLYLPTGAPRLELSTAGGAKSKLAVRVADDTGVRTVWEGKGAPAWADHSVDLSASAGRAVRLDLDATGPADWGLPRIVSARPSDAGAANVTADHVIVWVVSSLRADRLGTARTPAMSRFAERGVWFSRAAANAGTSGPAHAALMTGRRLQAGAIPENVPTIGQRFREAGFATALISGNGFVNRDAGFARGFDVYENPMRRRRPHGAKLLWQSARKFLSRRKQSHVFVLLATSEPHLPYTPSDESLAAERVEPSPRVVPARTADLADRVRAKSVTLTAEEQSFVRALYDAEVRDADSAFAEMIADLDALGIADRTAVILVADHGQELFDRGGFGHGHQLFDEIRHIPLALWAPGLDARRIDDINVELIDVYPTALALAGVSSNPGIQGQNLLPYARGARPVAPRPVFSAADGIRAVTIGHFTLVEAKTSELYDTRADPAQQSNTIDAHPIATRVLRNALGLQTAYRDEWSRRRWGTEVRMTEAFAADHGL